MKASTTQPRTSRSRRPTTSSSRSPTIAKQTLRAPMSAARVQVLNNPKNCPKETRVLKIRWGFVISAFVQNEKVLESQESLLCLCWITQLKLIAQVSWFYRTRGTPSYFSSIYREDVTTEIVFFLKQETYKCVAFYRNRRLDIRSEWVSQWGEWANDGWLPDTQHFLKLTPAKHKKQVHKNLKNVNAFPMISLALQ